MRWRSRSMSSTLTLTVSPMVRISLGWLTCDHDSSEMWIRPSIPSRSTNAPKSTMFEIVPSTTWPRLQPVEDLLAVLLALLLEHRAAREHDVVARAVELDHLALDLLAQVLVEVRHAADVDQRGGQEAAHAEVDDQAALDDLDDRALDRLARLGGGLDAAPRLLEAGALLGQDQAAVLVLLGEDERVDLLAELDLVGGVDRLADRQLVGGDDALGLVADVDEHLVLVDADDLAGDDVALLERRERGVVVGDDLAVDLEQEAVGALDDLARRRAAVAVGCGHESAEVSEGRASALGIRTAIPPPYHRPPCRTRATKRGAERTPLDGDCDVLICGASFAGLAVARELAGSRRARADASTATRSASARPPPAASRRRGYALGARGRRSSRPSASWSSTRPTAPCASELPWTFSTFDYRTLCALLREQAPTREFETAKVGRAHAATSCTPTAATCARR